MARRQAARGARAACLVEFLYLGVKMRSKVMTCKDPTLAHTAVDTIANITPSVLLLNPVYFALTSPIKDQMFS